MNNVICGYCEQQIEAMNKRYWFFNTKKKISYPLFVHSSCGVKIFEQSENIWTFHNLGKQHSKAIITPTEMKKEVEIDEVIYEQSKLNI